MSTLHTLFSELEYDTISLPIYSELLCSLCGQEPEAIQWKCHCEYPSSKLHLQWKWWTDIILSQQCMKTKESWVPDLYRMTSIGLSVLTKHPTAVVGIYGDW